MGETFDLGLSSFSESEDVASGYAGRTTGGTVYRLATDSRSLNIQAETHPSFRVNEEWLTTGRFRVTSIDSVRMPGSRMGTWDPYELTVVNVEQVTT